MRTAGIALLASAGLLAAESATAQNWDPNKVYFAGSPGSPSAFRYTDANGPFPGWLLNDTAGTIIHQAPNANAGGIGGLEASFFRVVSGKQKHLTSNWPALNGAAATRTGLLWRLYIPSSPVVDKMPSIQIRTHGERHHLDFAPDAGKGGVNPLPGWVAVENVNITGGGRLKLDAGGERYLPMSMDAWHTIRMEITGPTGQFSAWIDEEEGLSDVKRVTCVATKDGSGDYIEIGVRSTLSGSTQYWTNYLAWGQDTGVVDQIGPFLSPNLQVEICDNGIDDDSDGLADCADPGCECNLPPEDNAIACTNGADDDGDGLYDCEDPDCTGVATEQSGADCFDAIDNDCDGLIDCDDPDCGDNLACGPNEPQYVVTSVRQLGNWQNSCNPVCGSVLFFSAYDEDGNPLDGVNITDPVNNVTVTTHKDPGQGADGQSGHARHDPFNGLKRGVYRFHVSGDSQTSQIASKVTPLLYTSLPPNYERSSWQIEFMRKSKRSNPATFSPLSRVYEFNGVDMNVPPGPNTTLADDFSYLGGGTGPSAPSFVQTFTANTDRIVSARMELSVGFLATFRYAASIHPLINDPPVSLADLGPQIGPTRMGPNNMIDSEWWTQMLLWPVDGPDSVPVTRGQRYAIRITRIDNPSLEINAFRTNSDWYSGGTLFRQGAAGSLVPDFGFDVTGYIVGASLSACTSPDPVFDVTGPQAGPDGHVDGLDFNAFRNCATGPAPAQAAFDALPDPCRCMDRNGDQAIDGEDFAAFQRCFTGTVLPVDPACDD